VIEVTVFGWHEVVRVDVECAECYLRVGVGGMEKERGDGEEGV
jgi:hypothetical protein